MLQRFGGGTTAKRVAPRTAFEGVGKAFQKVRQVALRGAARNGSKRRWDCSMSMIVLCPLLMDNDSRGSPQDH
jgi:hypothetical protein